MTNMEIADEMISLNLRLIKCEEKKQNYSCHDDNEQLAARKSKEEKFFDANE